MKKDLIVVGDRVLIEPDRNTGKTDHGLYLPQGVREKEKVQSGTVVKTGPGYPIPDPNSVESEPWSMDRQEAKRYFPLQARPGDHCVFLRSAGIEIQFEKKKLLIVPHSAILVLVRGDIDKALKSILKDGGPEGR